MKGSAGLRFAIRQILVAVAATFAASAAQGEPNWDALKWGIASAVVSTVVGLLGPHEPFVGVKYAAEVPAPPAEADNR